MCARPTIEALGLSRVGNFPKVDHIGLVAEQLDPLCQGFAALGFEVSPAVSLQRIDEKGQVFPLGQSSAHIVLPNGYVELSAPHRDAPENHLWPHLRRHGPGARILAFSCADAVAAQRELSAQGLSTGPVQLATRALAHMPDVRAEFRWFPGAVDDSLAALTCWVEQRTPDWVFHERAQSPAWLCHRIEAFLLAATSVDETALFLRDWARVEPGQRDYPPLLPRLPGDPAQLQDEPSLGVVGMIMRCGDRRVLEARLGNWPGLVVEDDGILWVRMPGVNGFALGFTQS